MTAGDIGVAISINAGGYVLTGATCKLIAAPGRFTTPNTYPPANALCLTPAVVQANGENAVYTTTGDDFMVGGYWTAWLQVVGSGVAITSQPTLFYVYPAP